MTFQPIHLVFSLLLLSMSVPASAETLEELDRLAEASVEEQPGIALAQAQAERGELLEAIATLERVLALHPKSQNARLLHAVYLCDTDDQLGGAVELGKLKRKKYPDQSWSVALSRCPLDVEN